MSPQSNQVLAKDDELRRFVASQDGGATMSVIIEAVAPAVRVGRVTDPVLGGLHRRPLVATDPAGRSEAVQTHLDRISAALRQWPLEEEPTVLPAAHAVVARVLPSQLRGLLELSDDVAVIRRNRDAAL